MDLRNMRCRLLCPQNSGFRGSCLDKHSWANESMNRMADGVTNELQASLETWHTLAPEERVDTFKQLPYVDKDDFFLALSARDQSELIRSLPQNERRIWMRLLPPDDATDLIQETPEEDRGNLLALLDDYTRREVVALLAYAEDNAGDRKSTRLNSSHVKISYAVFCLKKKKK